MTLRREAFLARVKERGEYGTEEEAERAARVVLALIVLNPLQRAEPLPTERFVRATAAWIEGATEQTATWDVSAVLSTVADTAGEDLLRQILLQLPVGYVLLFGRPQPI